MLLHCRVLEFAARRSLAADHHVEADLLGIEAADASAVRHPEAAPRDVTRGTPRFGTRPRTRSTAA